MRCCASTWPPKRAPPAGGSLRRLFTLVCLPFEAFIGLDAVLRTTGRMLFTHRRLLEWRPSGRRNAIAARTWRPFFRSMWIGPVIATAATIHLGISRPGRAGDGRTHPGPLVGFPSRRVVDELSDRSPRAALSAEQVFFLRKLSRNLGVLRNLRRPGTPLAAAGQLPGASASARPPIAPRRPTWGLSLLANMAAATSDTSPPGNSSSARQNALRTMETLARHRGHFYNWYDTQSLSRCCLSTSRRWTAGTSRAIS